MLRQGDGAELITEATVEVGGRKLRLRANARSPWLYRFRFGRDIFADLDRLREKYKKIIGIETDAGGELIRFDSDELKMFAAIFYTLHLQAQPRDKAKCPSELIDRLPELPAVAVLPAIFAIWNGNMKAINAAKESHPATTREFNAALYMLRSCELGLTEADLDGLTVGMVSDMLTERADDRATWNIKGTPEMLDKLFGG